jgi:cysteinyl-tRNA synthetase
MIEKLMAGGHAYAGADGSVYFRVSSFKDYGRLSHLEDRELRLGASEGASATDSDEYTKDSLADFALWKARKPEDGENFWPSPWGEGRPGWHLECSAMIKEYLGDEFDMHSGGVDLIFPHHENEIAQSCCSTHGKFAHHWMHVAHLMVDGGKMSKSLGNLYTLEDLNKRGFNANEVRHVLIAGHYSAPLNFTFHSLESAQQALQKLTKFETPLREKAGATQPPTHQELIQHGTPGPFAQAWTCLLDDLNVPGALGGVFSVIKEVSAAATTPAEARHGWLSLWFILDALGLTLPPPASSEIIDVPAEIQALAQKRWDAKQAKDWAAADTLRKELEASGWIIKDSKEGFTVIPK